MTTNLSDRCNDALKHLKRIKPLDGWSIEAKERAGHQQVRLCRRSVPLTDNYFLDIHHDSSSSSVVGILTNVGRDGKAQAQILVDSKGNPIGRKVSLVQVTSWTKTPAKARSSSIFSSIASAASAVMSDNKEEPVQSFTGRPPASNSTTSTTVSPEQNMAIIKFAGTLIGVVAVCKVVFQTMFLLYIVAFPMAYLYLVQTCPSQASFDVKKELRRVLRGHHLPEDHPDKPKGFFSEALARLNANLATELATFPGYEVTMVPFAGALIISCVRVPSAKRDFYWVGANSQWYYVYAMDIAEDNAG